MNQDDSLRFHDGQTSPSVISLPPTELRHYFQKSTAFLDLLMIYLCEIFNILYMPPTRSASAERKACDSRM